MAKNDRTRGNGEGTIYESPKGSGKWRGAVTIGFTDAGKPRRKYVSGKTREETSRKVVKLLKDVQDGSIIVNERSTVAEFLDEWLAHVKKRRRYLTWVHYEKHVRLHIRPKIGRIPLAHLKVRDVTRMMEEAPTAKTGNKVRVTLRAALNVAMEWEILNRNVAALASPLKAAPKKTIEPLSPEEVRRLFDVMREDRLYALYVLAIGLGLRESELLGLRWQDVLWEADMVNVSKQAQRIDGQLMLVEPKTEKSKQPLPMIPFVREALLEHQERQERAKATVSNRWHNNNLVFPTTVGTIMDSRNLIRSWSRALETAKIPHRNFHNTRHSCASLLYASGSKDREVMEMLRHSQIGITLTTYTHISRTFLRDAANRMGEVFNDQA